MSGRAIVSYQVPRCEIPRGETESVGAGGESQGQHLVQAEAIGRQGRVQDEIIRYQHICHCKKQGFAFLVVL